MADLLLRNLSLIKQSSVSNLTFPLNTSVQSSTSYSVEQLTKTYAIGIATLILGIVGLLGNGFGLFDVYLQYRKNRQRSAATLLLFANASFASLVYSGYIMILTGYTQIYSYNQIVATKTYDAFCKASAFIYFVLCAVCAFSHSSIALNRLLAVVFGARYPVVKSMKTTWVLLFFTWFIPFLIFMYPLWEQWGIYGFSPANRCAFKKLNPDYLFTYKIIYYCLPFAIMLVCYSWIIVYSYMSKQRVKKMEAKPKGTDDSAKKARQNDMRLTKVAFITCMAFLLCFIPNAVFGIAVKDLKVIQSDVGIGFNFWVWIGGSLAPLVYTFLSSEMCATVGKRLHLRPSVGPTATPSTHTSKVGPEKMP